MLDDQPLVHDWHPVAREGDLANGRPVAAHLLGEEVVLWRPDADCLLAWHDLCVHRGARLSLGRIDGATLECPYHG